MTQRPHGLRSGLVNQLDLCKLFDERVRGGMQLAQGSILDLPIPGKLPQYQAAISPDFQRNLIEVGIRT